MTPSRSRRGLTGLLLAAVVGAGALVAAGEASAQWRPQRLGIAPVESVQTAQWRGRPGYGPRAYGPRAYGPRAYGPRYGYRRGWGPGAAAAGIVGGLALGALAAGALAAPPPPPVAACHIERERFWTGYAWRWRDVEVCP